MLDIIFYLLILLFFIFGGYLGFEDWIKNKSFTSLSVSIICVIMLVLSNIAVFYGLVKTSSQNEELIAYIVDHNLTDKKIIKKYKTLIIEHKLEKCKNKLEKELN